MTLKPASLPLIVVSLLALSTPSLSEDAASRNPAIGFRQMHVAEVFAGIEEACGHRPLFDVHVVGVEMDKDVRCTDPFDDRHRLSRRIQEMGLVPIARLEPEAHVERISRLRDMLENMER